MAAALEGYDHKDLNRTTRTSVRVLPEEVDFEPERRIETPPSA